MVISDFICLKGLIKNLFTGEKCIRKFLKRLRLPFYALVTNILSKRRYFCPPAIFICQKLTKC